MGLLVQTWDPVFDVCLYLVLCNLLNVVKSSRLIPCGSWTKSLLAILLCTGREHCTEIVTMMMSFEWGKNHIPKFLQASTMYPFRYWPQGYARASWCRCMNFKFVHDVQIPMEKTGELHQELPSLVWGPGMRRCKSTVNMAGIRDMCQFLVCLETCDSCEVETPVYH